jgi:uncharacterized Zn finger protein
MFIIIRCPSCKSACMEINRKNRKVHCNACGADHDPARMTYILSELETPDGTVFIDDMALEVAP